MYDLWRLKLNFQEIPPPFGCERWDNIFLKSQFKKFISDLGFEIELLEHLLQCEACKNCIRIFVEKDEWDSTERWSTLFLKDLPERYEPFNDAVSVYYVECPRFEDYQQNIERFIEDRIMWRIDVIKKIFEDAELEIGELSKSHNY